MRFRTSLVILLCVAILAIGLFSILVADGSLRTTDEKQQMTAAEGHTAFLSSCFSPDGSFDKTLFDRYGKEHKLRLSVIETDGTVLYDSMENASDMDNHLWREEVKEALQNGTGDSSRTSTTTGERTFYAARTTNSTPMLVIRVAILSSTTLLWRQLFFSSYLPLLLVAMLVSLICAFLLVSHLTRPLTNLTDAAKRYGKGDLEGKLWIEGPKEITALADTMETMASELNEKITELENARSTYAAILASMTEGVVLLDRKKQVLLENDASELFLGKGKNLLELLPEPSILEAVDKTLEKGTVEKVEREHAGKTFQMTISPIDEKGTIVGTVMTIEEITEIKKLELVRKDFVSNVSHELKTPLTSLVGFSDILSGKELTDGERIHYAEIIHRSAEQMQSIISDLLTLASLEKEHASIPLSSYPVQSIIDETLSRLDYLAKEKHAVIIVDNPLERGTTVPCNPSLLVQALLNLVANAILYSKEPAEVRIVASVSDAMLSLCVIDHGCGIAKEDQERVFERFYRVDKARSRKEGGTGLGLSIVRHIALVHGGNVSLLSELGKGSTFTLSIPKDDRISSLMEKSDALYGKGQLKG